MKKLAAIFIIAIFAWSLNSCDPGKGVKNADAATPPSKDSLVKRGNYLVTTLGCNDCHSPKKMGPKGPYIDSARMLSGFPSTAPIPVAGADDIKRGLVVFAGDLTAAIGPWGTSFAANITSDATGIGSWKEDQFKNALRHGKYKGLDSERSLLPPMPWQDLTNLTDADIEAIFTYLQSTKPVNNVVPAFRPAGKG
ncbi:c-type cytochrome [Mucilaginibacter gotjawali]|uniref:Gluconate 2-dehydrogenase cytochrome c subunit n=2 Tax=Mucilaginibacter gotjawali TaxID=1550579 RepID=A0A125T2D3_9SPHI|nr:c-type cytochrome [Mucilaginibacter gotjawali]MBB3059071.1 mono/diheme cytochrome c family protein [Mucilaginibacter gotjawali]BAU52856.1 Gluconate 2-dehydrogenase cytochrome c subunit precursor [Mucilaginibacter gotjawali]